MSRIPAVDPSTATGGIKTLLDGVQKGIAGLSDAEILDVVANVALRTFTNYLNEVAKTAIDFPVVTHHAR